MARRRLHKSILSTVFLFSFLMLSHQNCAKPVATPGVGSSQGSGGPGSNPIGNPGSNPVANPGSNPDGNPVVNPVANPDGNSAGVPQPASILGTWRSPCVNVEINTQVFPVIYTIMFSAGGQSTLLQEVFLENSGCNPSARREVDTFTASYSTTPSTQTYSVQGTPVGALLLNYTSQWTHIRLLDPADVAAWNAWNNNQGSCGINNWSLNNAISIVGTPCSSPPSTFYTTAIAHGSQLLLAIESAGKNGQTAAARCVGPDFASYTRVQ